MPAKKGPGAKAVAGRALKAANDDKKKAGEAAAQEAELARGWEQGTNARKQGRDALAAEKSDEAARKRREKAELLAADEAALGPGGTVPTSVKKKKNTKKKKDDLSLLEDSLVSAAEKKVKKQKALEREKQEKQAKTPVTVKHEEPIDPLLANTNAMLANHEMVGRDANKARMAEEGASGIDAALSVLSVGGDGVTLRSARASYGEFEERMLPVVKEEYPGLRLTQYKEKVWQLWKRSPENPANLPSTDS
jgi:hypothetical protein